MILNRNKYIKLTSVLIMVCLIFTMAACKKKNNASGNTDPAEVAATQPATTEVASSDNGTDSVSDEEPVKKEPAMPYEEYEKIYKEFLDNEEPLYFSWFLKSDNLKYSSWDYTEYKKYFKPSSAYVFSDFIENICSAYFDESGATVYPEEIYYSIIDCGDDKEPELLISVNGVEDGTLNYTDTWILKYMDNKLQIIQFEQSGYRSQFEINEYGYYQSGGSTGAATWCIEHAYIGADSVVRFDYGEDNTTSVWAFYVADNSEYQTVAEEQGIDENIEIEQFYFDKYDSEEEYSDFQNRSMWIYYELDGHYDRLEDNDDIYKAGNPYKTFWDSTKLNLSTEEEIDRAQNLHRADIGVTDRIINGEAASWTKLTDAQLETIYQWRPPKADITVLDEPSWEFYYWGYEAEPVTRLKLDVENKTPNDIIDENIWFAAMGMEEPDRLIYSDDKYTYRLYGEDPDGIKWYPYMLDICEKDTDVALYTLDFTNYYKPQKIKAGDEPFVEESIHWATIKDDILYVSTYHTTYASSAPENGYITAFDMKDNFKVLWRTKPLTCNSSNFIVTEDAIICGYGFTAEDDYVYVLDRGCGVRTASIKVKTSPEWFCLNDDQLFVRCYDTDYVFNVTNK